VGVVALGEEVVAEEPIVEERRSRVVEGGRWSGVEGVPRPVAGVSRPLAGAGVAVDVRFTAVGVGFAAEEAVVVGRVGRVGAVTLGLVVGFESPVAVRVVEEVALGLVLGVVVVPGRFAAVLLRVPGVLFEGASFAAAASFAFVAAEAVVVGRLASSIITDVKKRGGRVAEKNSSLY
jgi:hypothetical protein